MFFAELNSECCLINHAYIMLSTINNNNTLKTKISEALTAQLMMPQQYQSVHQ